jgi:hypothetical protein
MSRRSLIRDRYCLSLCVKEEDPLPVLQNPLPSISILTSGNGRKWVEIRIKSPSWNVCLKTLKRDLMETMESS